MRFLYRRDHLAQVLATFGIILIADDAVKAIWGVAPMMAPMTSGMSQPIMLLPGLYFPAYRLLLIWAGYLIALCLYLYVVYLHICLCIDCVYILRVVT